MKSDTSDYFDWFPPHPLRGGWTVGSKLPVLAPGFYRDPERIILGKDQYLAPPAFRDFQL